MLGGFGGFFGGGVVVVVVCFCLFVEGGVEGVFICFVIFCSFCCLFFYWMFRYVLSACGYATVICIQQSGSCK